MPLKADLVIRNGTLVTETATYPADVAISGGRISAILAPLQRINAEAELDARGLHVLPGLVDAHVHFNEPGRTHWEGYEAGSQAAAAGGVTTILDMPLNCIPPTFDLAALEEKRAAVAGKSVVDYGFWAGLAGDNAGDLDGLYAAGVVGWKAFMCDSGVPEYPRCGDGALIEGLRQLAPLGGILGVHAEAHEATVHLRRKLQAAGRTDARAWAESRPPAVESIAVATALRLASELGGSLHFVHVSSPEAVRLVAKARDDGARTTIETCPHYLALDEDDLVRLGPIAKCAPPLRTRPLVEELWSCLLNGQIDCVASDHSPCARDEKRLDCGDIWQAWGGISGIQTMLPLMLTEGHFRRGLSLPHLVRLLSANPARIFGLAPRKGSLRPGWDADVTLVDIEDEWRLAADDLLSRHKLSPFIGQRFKGRVRQTIVRGEVVYRDGEVVARPGHGQWVRPERRRAGVASR